MTTDQFTAEFDKRMAVIDKDRQTHCVLCGNGMVILPWGERVPDDDRLSFKEFGKPHIVVSIHRHCLTEVSAGRAISDALGYTEPER